MKALREFFVVILSMALVCVLTSIGIITGVKDVFQGTLVTEGIKEIVKVPEDNENAKEVNEAIDKIASYEGTKEIIDSFLDDASKSSNGNFTLSDKTYDLVLKALEDNKEEFMKMGVTEEDYNRAVKEMKDPETRKKINQDLSKGFNETNVNNTTSNVNVISSLTKIVAPSTVHKMIVAAVIIVSLIALLTFSPYKWIRPVSVSSIIAGINVGICYFGFDVITKMVLENNATMNLDASKLSTFAIGYFCGGIAGVVIYGILNGLSKKNKIDVVEETPKTEPELPKPAFNENAGYNKFCSLCGSPVGDEDKACGNCGAPLD